MCWDEKEGAEFDVLRSIDFDSVHISVISVRENREQPSIEKLLTGKGYTFATNIGMDSFYLHDSFEVPVDHPDL